MYARVLAHAQEMQLLQATEATEAAANPSDTMGATATAQADHQLATPLYVRSLGVDAARATLEECVMMYVSRLGCEPFKLSPENLI